MGQPSIPGYALGEVIGRGGMSVVYRARSGEDRVAVKLVLPELLAGPERASVIARFQREARIGLKLDHPKIVRVHEFGESGGFPFLSMELIEGRELKEFLGPTAHPLPIERKIDLLVQLLDALDHVHEHGIIHRDIKPGNALVGADWVLKLMDFGIAISRDDQAIRGDELAGTPAYMAPEQLVGQEVDRRADLFAAGVTAYCLLTGLRPFTGSIDAIISQVLRTDPMPPSRLSPSVPAEFDSVIATALAKTKTDRFQTARAFRDALLAALAASRSRVAAAPAFDFDSTVVWHRDIEPLIEALAGHLADEVGPDRLEDAFRELRNLDGILWTGGGRNACIEDAMRPLARRICTHAPKPSVVAVAGQAGWMDAVVLLRKLRDELEWTPLAREARAVSADVVADILKAYRDYADTLAARLDADDNPDVTALSIDLLRLDVLDMALSELGGRSDQEQARDAMIGFAAAVMRKVNASVRAYTESEDALAGFGVAVMLAGIEDLISIARRLVEPDAGGAAGSPFGRFDEDLIGEFIGNAGTLVHLIGQGLDADLAAPSEQGTGAFVGRIRQLAALYGFARSLPADADRSRLSALTTDVHDRVRRAVDSLVAGVGRGDAVAMDRLVVAYEIAEEMGWESIRRVAFRGLRPVIARAGRG